MLRNPARNLYDNVFPAVKRKVSGRKYVNASVCIANHNLKVIKVICTPHPEIKMVYRTDKRIFINAVSLHRNNLKPVVALPVIRSLYAEYLRFNICFLERLEGIRNTRKIAVLRIAFSNKTACIYSPFPVRLRIKIINNKCLYAF